MAALLLAGCAIGPVGTIVARVSPVAGGWLVDSYAVGVHLRVNGADDPGLLLGAGRRMYLFASDDTVPPRAGWYFLKLPPMAMDTVVLRHTTSAGIDLQVAAPAAASIGVQQTTVTHVPRAGSSTFRAVHFEAAAPADACVSTRWEFPC